MKKNRITICGRNTTTEPTPERIPSVMRSRAGPAATAGAHQLGQPADPAFQRIGKRCRPGEHRLEHHEQQREQDQRAEPGMQQHPVKPA
jgi:hypothetical protein